MKYHDNEHESDLSGCLLIYDYIHQTQNEQTFHTPINTLILNLMIEFLCLVTLIFHLNCEESGRFFIISIYPHINFIVSKSINSIEKQIIQSTVYDNLYGHFIITHTRCPT